MCRRHGVGLEGRSQILFGGFSAFGLFPKAKMESFMLVKKRPVEDTWEVYCKDSPGSMGRGEKQAWRQGDS